MATKGYISWAQIEIPLPADVVVPLVGQGTDPNTGAGTLTVTGTQRAYISWAQIELPPGQAPTSVLIGLSAAAAAGPPVPLLRSALLGKQATGAVGTLTTSGTAVYLTGLVGLSVKGTLTAIGSAVLSVPPITAIAGVMPTPGDVTVNLSGFLMLTSNDADIGIAGQSSTIIAGTLKPADSKALVGNAAAIVAGIVGASTATGANVALTGLVFATTVGTFGKAEVKAIAGQFATGDVGIFVPIVTLALSTPPLGASSGLMVSPGSALGALSGQQMTLTAGMFALSGTIDMRQVKYVEIVAAPTRRVRVSR